MSLELRRWNHFFDHHEKWSGFAIAAWSLLKPYDLPFPFLPGADRLDDAEDQMEHQKTHIHKNSRKNHKFTKNSKSNFYKNSQYLTLTNTPEISHPPMKWNIFSWGSNLESLQTEIIQNRSDGNSKIRWNNTTIIFIFSRPKLGCFVLWNSVTWKEQVQVILFDTNLLPTSSPTHQLQYESSNIPKRKTFHWHLSVNSVVFSKTFQKHFSKTFNQPVSSRVVFSKPAGSSLSPRQCCQSKHDQLIRHHHAVNQNMIEDCLHLPSCFSPSSCSLPVVVTSSPLWNVPKFLVILV